MKVFWSLTAMQRARQIESYIAQDKKSAAAHWMTGLLSKSKQLAKFPKSGRIVPEIGRSDVREILYGNYRLVYRIRSQRLYMMTVRHMKQLLPVDEIMKAQL